MVILHEFSPVVSSFDIKSVVMVVRGAVTDDGLGILDGDTQFVTGVHLNFRCIKPQQKL